jgi:MFS family permease
MSGEAEAEEKSKSSVRLEELQLQLRLPSFDSNEEDTTTTTDTTRDTSRSNVNVANSRNRVNLPSTRIHIHSHSVTANDNGADADAEKFMKDCANDASNANAIVMTDVPNSPNVDIDGVDGNGNGNDKNDADADADAPLDVSYDASHESGYLEYNTSHDNDISYEYDGTGTTEIPHADFPTIEVTVSRDNSISSTASDANYNHDYGHGSDDGSIDHAAAAAAAAAGGHGGACPVSPMSPLTPSHGNYHDHGHRHRLMNTSININSNGIGKDRDREANNLMNVLQKVSNKKNNQQNYNDIDMGLRNTTPPRNRNHISNFGNRNTASGNGNASGRRNRRMGIDYDYDSSSDDSSDATPTRTQTQRARNSNVNGNGTCTPFRGNGNGTRNGNGHAHGHGLPKPNPNHNRQVSWSNTKKKIRNAQSPLSPASSSSYYQSHKYSEFPQPPYSPNLIHHKPDDPTLLAQTFVLSLAFFAVWSPQNLMAPNLTQMADYFHFTPDQRDLYLGANIAFATGVLSLPVSALLGFLADAVSSRKKLFAYTVFMGGIAAMGTGYSTTYAQLYFCRFLCGGCMSGSVPIAFSILGDLFDAKDRNAASSGLTAMMGAGILLGQVVAGMIGGEEGGDGTASDSDSATTSYAVSAIESAIQEGQNDSWKRPFFISGFLSIITSLMVLYFVREPVRGGKEKVLQEMIASGAKYDRKLTLKGFLHAMTQNKTNVILMLQGFFTNIPWGVVFTFLNDYLSQEQGLSVHASTFLILWFGIGSATGMVVGGFIGTKAMRINSALLPLFMALSTALGILPFVGLLNLKLKHAGLLAVFLAFSGGSIPNFPSANVRPCLLNVNPPETRGAAMTAANLMINVARGAGPSLVTLSQRGLGVSRQYSFNLTIITFWSITTVLLVILAKTLPSDQEKMDAELARYAKSRINSNTNLKDSNGLTMDGNGHAGYGSGATVSSMVEDDVSEAEIRSMIHDDMTLAGEESIVSIEDRITTFDASAVQESWSFIEGALREIAELSHIRTRSNYEVIRGDEIVFNSEPNVSAIASDEQCEEQREPDQYGIGNETTL